MASVLFGLSNSCLLYTSQEGDADFRLGIPPGGDPGLGGAGHFLRHLEAVFPILVPFVVNRDDPIENFKVISKVRPADIADAFIQGPVSYTHLFISMVNI